MKVYKYRVTRHELVYAAGKHRPLIQGLPVTIGLFDERTDTIAQIFFHADTSTMPDQDGTPAEDDVLTRFVKANFLMSDYPHVYALLTGSAPLFCAHTRTPPQVWLTNVPPQDEPPQR